MAAMGAIWPVLDVLLACARSVNPRLFSTSVALRSAKWEEGSIGPGFVDAITRGAPRDRPRVRQQDRISFRRSFRAIQRPGSSSRS